MTCRELLQAVDPYLDDELSVLEVLRVQAHLLRCDPCRTAMESEARLRALLEADAMQDQPAPALRDQILQRLATLPSGPSSPERRRRRVAALYPVLAGVMLIAALLAAVMVYRFPGASNLPPFLEEVAAKHRLYTEATGPALDLKTADVGQLTGWLAGRLGFPLKAPARLRPGEHLVGGRVSSLADAPAAYLRYQRGNQPLSLFVTRRPSPAPPETNKWIVEGVELYTSRVHGLTLVWWEDDDHVYAAASTASPRGLAEFALLCIRSGPLASTRDVSALQRDATQTRGDGQAEAGATVFGRGSAGDVRGADSEP
jgi:anti-sigma factor RsiW